MMKNLTTRQKMQKSLLAIAIGSSFIIVPAQADTLTEVADAVTNSKTSVNLRYRLETVDQDGKADKATASTLRTRLTWQSGAVNNIKANIEVDNVTAIGAERYNSTENGHTNYPVVADPVGTDINLANFTYDNGDTEIIAGRQRILLNNQRFVGGVAWRQNEQTYDGVRVKYQANKQLSLDYSYIVNVNRIFGPDDGAQLADWHGNFHFLNAVYKVNKQHKLAFFGVLLNNDDAAAASSNSFGVDYQGKFGVINAALSYATQTDAGDNPNDYRADYYKAELSTKVSKVTLAAGLEVLSSDNGVGFATPLATLHKFEGFADKFLGTPGTGVKDYYVKAATKINKIGLTAFYHNFKSDVGSIDYGSEIDLVASYKLNKHASLLFKYAAYNADQRATDTDKLWAMVTMKF